MTTTDLTVTLRVPMRVNEMGPAGAVSMGMTIAAILSEQMGPVEYLGPTYARETPPPPRVSIHPAKYRSPMRGPGVPDEGFSVRASTGERIFTLTRTSAERIKARLLNGEDVRSEDFDA